MTSDINERYPLRMPDESGTVYDPTIFNNSNHQGNVELGEVHETGRSIHGCCPIRVPEVKMPKMSCEFSEETQYELRECFPYIFNVKEYFLQKVPFIWWLRKYSIASFISDVVAGMTVGLMVVPQALAYAKIAGLPLHFGLYSAFMGCFTYVLLGTAKDITMGPTAIMSLIVSSVVGGVISDGVDISQAPVYAAALCLMCGIIQLTMGLLNLGFIVDFIPLPVISGFTSAAAITIAMGQVKDLFGLQIPCDTDQNGTITSNTTTHIGHTFMDNVYETGKCIWTTRNHPWNIVLGFFSILLCLFLRFFKNHIVRLLSQPKLQLYRKIPLRFLWLMSTASNAVVVVLGALIAWSLCSVSLCSTLKLISNVEPGLPAVAVPRLSANVLEGLDVGIIVAPLIGFLESIAIAKAFARKNNYRIDPSQELIAIGVGNIAGSFMQSYPITGSFSRTAVNSQSGVKTPLGGIFTGGVVLLALGVLTPWFSFIPEASLAAIIITAVLNMVDFRIPLALWKTNKIELFPLAVSFFGTLIIGIEYGVPIACGVHIVFLLYRHARPRHKVTSPTSVLRLEFNGGLNYPGADYVIRRVTYELDKAKKSGVTINSVVLDGSHMPEIDFPVVQALEDMMLNLFHNCGINVTIIAQPQVFMMLQKVKSRKIFTLVPCDTPDLNVDSPMLQSDDSRNGSPSMPDL